jgi:AcrR family transcriptional regulator
MMKKDDSVRGEILRAAETLFQKWGIKKTTMEDIAREAGKGKSTLYYYFKSKDAVKEAVAMSQADRITRFVQEEIARKGTAKAKLLTYVYISFRETRRALTLYEIAKGDIKKDSQLLQKVTNKYYAVQEKMVGDILRFGKERREFKSIGTRDIGPVVRAIVTTMRSLTMDLFIENEDKKVIDLIIELLSEGL